MTNRVSMETTVLLIAVLVFLQIPPVGAIGVAPGKKIYEFEPNLQTIGTIAIVNSDHLSMRAAIQVTGELAPYLTIDQESVSFLESEGEKQVGYELILPASLDKPGIHEAQITISQLSQTEQVGAIDIGAAVSITSKIQVRVPYPGKYAQASLDIINRGEKADFILLASNAGEESINAAKAQIDIFDYKSSLISQVHTTEQSIESRERKEFIATWHPNASPGDYKARVLFVYDGFEQIFARDFTLGEFFIRPLSLSVGSFKIGDVAKFDLLVENLANVAVLDFIAELSLLDEQNVSAMVTPSIPETIEALSQKQISMFWPAENIKLGDYHGTLSLRYGSNSVSKDVLIRVSKKKIEVELEGADQRFAQMEQPKAWKDTMEDILIVLALLAAPFILWMILHLRRKLV